MQINRRRFLKGGISTLGAASIAAGIAWLSGCSRGERVGVSPSPRGLPTDAGPFGTYIDRSSLWQHSGNLLWGFDNAYHLKVLYDPQADPNYSYRGWFFGWATADCNAGIFPGYTGCDAIFAARSQSLDSGWQVYAGNGNWDNTMNPQLWKPVLSANHTYYDQEHNGDPSVVKVGATYYLAYSSTGYNQDSIPFGLPGDTDGGFQCLMGATSTDGINWQPSAAPIMQNPAAYGAPTSIAGYDVHYYSDYARPALLYENGKFEMWWDYPTPQGGGAVAYAENQGDFMNPSDWVVSRSNTNPCTGLANFPNPDVQKIGNVYFGYGDPRLYGQGWPGRKIAEAISLDRLQWVMLGYVNSDSDAPAIMVPVAFVRQEGSETWMYVTYACQIGGAPYNFRFNRIRHMRRQITSDMLSTYQNLWNRTYA